MDLFPVFNLIVHHFLQSYVSNVVIFNCWNETSQLNFLRYANDKLLRTQMVDINKDLQFPGGYLNGVVTALGIYLDFSCNKSRQILNKGSELQLFIGKYNWLIYDENYNFSKFHQQFEDTMMSINAQISYVAADKTGFIFYDVYNNGKKLNGKLNITIDKRIACHNDKCETKYLSTLYMRTKYKNRCNLNDTTFRISTVVTNIPLNSSEKDIVEHLSSPDNVQNNPLGRFGFNIVVVLRDMMNFKVILIHRDVWSTNEVSGGSMGDLVDNNAELSASGFVPTISRLKKVSVITPIAAFRSVFIFRTPHNQGLYGGVFLRPFSTSVWISFVVVIILFAIWLWAVFTVEFKIARYIGFIPSLLHTFLISFGLACFQGASLIPCSAGGRIAFFSLSLVTFIMYNYYTSIVVSSLVGSPIKSNIKTVDQLADSSLEIGFEPAAHTKVFLNVSTTPGVRKLVEKKVDGKWNDDSEIWKNPKDGVLRVREGGFAYNSLSATSFYLVSKYFKQHELCDLNIVSLRPDTKASVMQVKNSTYKEIIRLNMLRMIETGVLLKHQRHWMNAKLDCFSSNMLIDVGLEYTGPLFILLGLIYILAVMVLLFEIAYHKHAEHGYDNKNGQNTNK